MKKIVLLLIIIFTISFSGDVFAGNLIKGEIQSVDKDAGTITIKIEGIKKITALKEGMQVKMNIYKTKKKSKNTKKKETAEE